MSRLELAFQNVFQMNEQAVSFGIHEDYTIISWGSTIGPVKDALRHAKKRRNLT